MATDKMLNQIEAISMAIVMAEPSDLQTLSDLHTGFNEISALASACSQDLVAKAASASVDLIEKLILGEVSDGTAALDTIARTMTAIQAIIRDQRDIEEVEFPEELGLTFHAYAGQEPPPESVDELSSPPKEQQPAQEFFIVDPELVCDFISEAREHLDTADLQLLTLETEPENEDTLNAVFRCFHTIKGVAGFLDLKDISSLAHTVENLLDRARKGEIVLTGSAIEVTFDAVKALRRQIDNLEAALQSDGQPVKDESLPELLAAIAEAASGEIIEVKGERDTEDKKLGEILVEDNTIDVDTVQEALEEQEKEEPRQKLGEMLVARKQVAAKNVAGALRKQKGARAGVRIKETIRIDTERLDLLVDTIGELVIAESMVSQDEEIRGIGSVRVYRNLGHLSKITRELQEIGMSMRMVPIGPTFQKMARVVRDLAKKAGKNVNCTLAGEDTELDRSVVERIGDPLIHMVRNAVDHGIESSADRRKAGKSETGHIELRAFHKGGSIYIEIEDDGRGLDREAILAKARNRGLGDSLSDREVFNLIFEPGFSTTKKVTDVSGRGVGMDVVKKGVEALRGRVDIFSDIGKGCTFSVCLPLTLAITDGMLVKVGDQRYIVPTVNIYISFRPNANALSTIAGRGEMVMLRGELMPIVRLHRLFGITGAVEDPTKGLLVIVGDGIRRCALLVDELLGQQQVVAKSLGEGIGKVQGISGGAILSDGRVGLILDPSGIAALTRQADSENRGKKSLCQMQRERNQMILDT